MSQVVDNRNPAFTVWVLWGALLASQALYAGIVLFAAPPPGSCGPLVPILSAFAGLQGAAALAAYFLLQSDERIRGWLKEARAGGKTRDEAQGAAVARLQPLSVLAWALAESVTLVGLALSFMGQLPFQRFLIFLAGGVAIHLICLPRVGRVEPLAREVYL